MFQRTPPWLIPTPDYHDDVARGLRWLLRARPVVRRVVPLLHLLAMAEALLAGRRASTPTWDADRRSVSLINDVVRQLLTEYLTEQFADRPDLLEQGGAELPAGAPSASCATTASGRATLKRDDVALVTDGIARDHRRPGIARPTASSTTST